jgi:hypothetical protein
MGGHTEGKVVVMRRRFDMESNLVMWRIFGPRNDENMTAGNYTLRSPLVSENACLNPYAAML